MAKIDVNEKEIRAIMDSLSVVTESIDSDIVMVTFKERKRLENIDLNDLYIKIHAVWCDKFFRGRLKRG